MATFVSLPARVAREVRLLTPAVNSTTAVHAAYNSTAANIWTGTFTDPVVRRSLTVAFSGTWDGGNVAVSGTDPTGAAITETFTANAGNTVAGTKVFATVSGATKVTVGAAGTASIGTGSILGIAGLSQSDTYVKVDATAQAFSIQLPDATTVTSGRRCQVKKIDSSANAVTVVDAAGGNIDGAASQVLSVQYDEINLLTDGTVWLT